MTGFSAYTYGAAKRDLTSLAGISALSYHKEAVDGTNIRPALLRAIAAIKAAGFAGMRTLTIPPRVDGAAWTVDAQVKWDLSNFILILPAKGQINMTATTRQETFYFGYDLPVSGQPTQSLSNVSVYGNGCVIDGNGAGMTFSYANGDGSDNNSGVRFNYIDNLYVEGLWAKNGPIDSMSVRQCRNWLVNKCVFSTAREDNGFSATTDWPGYTYGNPDTYGYGSCVDCVSFDNEDTGFTAYNVSDVKFVRCRSYRNTTGFTMEDAFTTPNVKTYNVSFIGCHAWNVVQAGFYIDGNGVVIDDDCMSWNARGYTGDNTNSTFENGVIVSGATNVYVGGDHSNCGRAGLFITNNTGNPCEVRVAAKLHDNDAHGLYARGVSLLVVTDKTVITGNGKVLVAAAYSPGVMVSNNGASFLTGTGIVRINRCVIDDNGLGAVNVEYVKNVDIEGVVGDNAKSGTGVISVIVRNATTAKVVNCHLLASSGNATFALLLDNNVLRGYEGFNTGDGTTGVVSNLAATVAKVARWQLTKTQAWAVTTLGGVPAAVATVPGKLIVQVTIPGIDQRDEVLVSADFDPLNCILRGRVSAPNNVQVELVNFTTSVITPANGNITVLVFNRNAG